MFHICLLKCRNSLNVSLSIFLFLNATQGNIFITFYVACLNVYLFLLEQKVLKTGFSVALNEKVARSIWDVIFFCSVSFVKKCSVLVHLIVLVGKIKAQRSLYIYVKVIFYYYIKHKCTIPS